MQFHNLVKVYVISLCGQIALAQPAPRESGHHYPLKFVTSIRALRETGRAEKHLRKISHYFPYIAL